MARAKIPDPLARRLELERELDPAKARAVAEAYRAEGRSVEALAFLAKAKDREGLAAIRDEAVREGDVFLLRECARELREEIDLATWRAVAESAAAAGKQQYADEAARMAAALGG